MDNRAAKFLTCQVAFCDVYEIVVHFDKLMLSECSDSEFFFMQVLSAFEATSKEERILKSDPGQ